MAKLGNIKVYRGNPLIMGATVMGDEVNFAITAKVWQQVRGSFVQEKVKTREACTYSHLKTHRSLEVCTPCVCLDLIIQKYDYNFCVDGWSGY